MRSQIVGLMVGVLIVAVARGSERPPNILLITADNLGYADLPVFNPDSNILAPNLDALAASGVRLTSFYTASPTCTVSRACLLTGRVADRHGLTRQLPGIAGNYGPGLRASEVLLPQMLKAVGYRTGCFGKWNIGFSPGSRPTERGFDEFFGHASGNIDYYTHKYNMKHDLYRGTVEAHVEGYSTDLFADAAIDFIQRNRSQAWFAYLPFNAPHFPNARNKPPGTPNIWQAPDRAFRRYGYDPATQDPVKRYRAVVTAMDEAIGRVLRTIRTHELERNTFVVFYSDNGAFMLKDRGLEVSSNDPLRDGGVTCWEGGIRVAAIASWPGRIPPRSDCHQVLWSPDLLPTCAGIAGASVPSDRTLDGVNIIGALAGRATLPNRSLYFTYGKYAALRSGPWKILRTQSNGEWKLFNLEHDIGESASVAGDHPKVVRRLETEFRRWQTDIQMEQAP